MGLDLKWESVACDVRNVCMLSHLKVKFGRVGAPFSTSIEDFGAECLPFPIPAATKSKLVKEFRFKSSSKVKIFSCVKAHGISCSAFCQRACDFVKQCEKIILNISTRDSLHLIYRVVNMHIMQLKN